MNFSRKMFQFFIALLFMATVPSISANSQEPPQISGLAQHPDSLELHMSFIEEYDGDIDSLINHYEILRKQFPKSVSIPYAMGKSLFYRSHSQAQAWLQNAINVDPTFAEAYMVYGLDAERWGDAGIASTYLKKAVELDPNNATFAFYEANLYANQDLKKYIEKMRSVAARFKGTKEGSMALYWMGDKDPDSVSKANYYLELEKSYPLNEFHFAKSGMVDYFDLLVDSDCDLAVDLADKMCGKEVDSVWCKRLRYATKIREANKQYELGKFEICQNLLTPLVRVEFKSIANRAVLLLADSWVNLGQVDKSIELLTASFIENPDTEIYNRMQSIAMHSGRDSMYVKDHLKSNLLKRSVEATNLEAIGYLDGKSRKLSEYRGSNVLLSFWFPTCGPCHAEFPHIEHVLNTVANRQDIVYLGVNMVHEQDDYVVPFVEKGNVSFVPVKDDEEKRGNLVAEVAPMNYLIDKNGQIVYKDFIVNAKNRDVLSLMFWIIS